eukprot:5020963-Prymnesium_polylepis.2
MSRTPHVARVPLTWHVPLRVPQRCREVAGQAGARGGQAQGGRSRRETAEARARETPRGGERREGPRQHGQGVAHVSGARARVARLRSPRVSPGPRGHARCAAPVLDRGTRRNEIHYRIDTQG